MYLRINPDLAEHTQGSRADAQKESVTHMSHSTFQLSSFQLSFVLYSGDDAS
jgi:hypothetical protein